MANIKIDVRVPAELVAKLDKMAKEKYGTRAGMIRQAIAIFVNDHEIRSKK